MFRLSSDEGDYLKCQVGISSRGVRRVFTFVAQQRLLPCATNDAALRNKGVGGCARWLAGVVSSKERSAHLLGEKCAPFKREVRTSS